MKSSLFFPVLVLIASPQVFSQTSPAFEINERLGRGINMGNSFEAPTETAWDNPWQPEYFEIMADLGFQHVRLPVRWETPERSLETAPWTISSSFLERIQEVVDAALENNLLIIVNMHHHEKLFEDPEGQKERFLSQWSQIAGFFKDYPDELLFEVLNEPHGNLTPELWNQFFDEAMAIIRETNPNRTVIMGIAEYGGLGGLPRLVPPDDDNVIVSIHYYNPFNFTHQGAEWVGEQSNTWLGTEWLDTQAEREMVENEFAPALAFSEENNIPIHVGEFGAYYKADLDSRVRWTNFLARWFEEQNLSWAYWEFSAGFGIYNPGTQQLLQPLSDALLVNEMPEPTPTESIAVYESDFSVSTDGWSLFYQGGASAVMAAEQGKIHVLINNGGTQSWHVQVSRNGMELNKGRMYRIVVKASSSSPRNVTVYAGKASDPWTSYSGYSGVSLSEQETTYSITFTMNNDTDTQARIVFDMGLITGDVWISEIDFEEILFITTGLNAEVVPGFRYFPNPVDTRLYLSDYGPYQQVHLFDLKGNRLRTLALHEPLESIDMGKYPPGMYMIGMSGGGLPSKSRLISKQ